MSQGCSKGDSVEGQIIFLRGRGDRLFNYQFAQKILSIRSFFFVIFMKDG